MTDAFPMRDMAEEAMEELHRSDWLTTDGLQRLIDRGGRNCGPVFLSEACDNGIIGDDTVTALVGRTWSMAEFPDRLLDHSTWRELFRVAGFTVDGRPAERPAEPVELWRGSVPEHRTDWSWSTDRTVAEGYAAGRAHRGPGRLYRLVAPPEALLCANTERGEAEYVVDTDGLLIEEVSR